MEVKKRIIVWEKWADPYAENIDDIEWPGAFEQQQQQPEYPFIPGAEGLDGNHQLAQQYQYQPIPIDQRPIKAIHTAMGIVPMTEYTLPSKVFNFHVGHANFNLTPNALVRIENVEGVEILQPLSRYRFKIGIGKAFETSDTKLRINKALNAESSDVKENT